MKTGLLIWFSLVPRTFPKPIGGKILSCIKHFSEERAVHFLVLVKDDGFILIAQTDRKINGEILPNHITYYNAMIDYGWKLKDYKIVVRNHPVEKRDMYTFNYQHCLIFTKTGTIKRAGDYLKGYYGV